MYLGIDHGTNAMRFAALDKHGKSFYFEVPRTDMKEMEDSQILELIQKQFNINIKQIEMIALTYSMGDGIVNIMDIQDVHNRGVRSIEGVGKKTGAGTLVFDTIKKTQIPAVVIPGIHSQSHTDSRMNVFSHSTSPEKLGIAYDALSRGINNFIVSDISSNTVTLAVANGAVVGALDACIFAPGTVHGPLDLESIRQIDAGKCGANEAFMNSGVLKNTSYKNTADLLDGLKDNEDQAKLAIDTLALFASMEIEAMKVLLKDYSTCDRLFLAGSMAEVDPLVEKIHHYLDMKPWILGKWSAATGCARMARDIAKGKKQILGIEVSI
ncbi:methanogenesis marker 12 protein [Methanohalophilus sp. WG1-DM]|uniref:methanogenesis marker 12 protein n=1 Tax=Methanohalophilus sp. WG1-DM TaxID=2491675 RepID=UPI000FFF4E0C|nr:methanogenesis marker 12 protein [Methanohalophilus sp. WG1-DM]RXG35004.1 methanoproteinis marker protein 12 [Methanohalophilus sp. WG1-DM]